MQLSERTLLIARALRRAHQLFPVRDWAGVQFDPNGSLHFSKRHADSYLQDSHIERVDLIKIDVDGNEYDIICGLRSCIDHVRPIVMVEMIADMERNVRPGNYQIMKYGDCGNVFCLPPERARR